MSSSNVQEKWIMTKPLRKMNKKERQRSRILVMEAFVKEYGLGVFQELMASGVIKWNKK